MLDHLLEVMHDAEVKKAEQFDLVEDLKKLPMAELLKVAYGGPVACGEGDNWMYRFRGTPLFDQALALEQADLQNDSARLQSEVNRPALDTFYRTGDQIRLQKRLLELQLLQLENQAVQPQVDAPLGGAAIVEKQANAFTDLFSHPNVHKLRTDLYTKLHAAPAAPVTSAAERWFHRLQNPTVPDQLVGSAVGGLANAVTPNMQATGLGRLGELLSGSRHQKLKLLHSAANVGGMVPGVVSTSSTNLAKALEKEIASERLKSLVTRAGAGTVAGGALLYGATMPHRDFEPQDLPKLGAASTLVDSWARGMAQRDLEKVSTQKVLDAVGVEAGNVMVGMTKCADPLLGGLKGAWRGVTSTLGRMNAASGGRLGTGALVGTIGGGLAGAASGTQRDAYGQTHVLRNALLGAGAGAGLGAFGGGVANRMAGGQGFTTALGGTAAGIPSAAGKLWRAGTRGNSVGRLRGGFQDLIEAVKPYGMPVGGAVVGIPAVAAVMNTERGKHVVNALRDLARGTSLSAVAPGVASAGERAVRAATAGGANALDSMKDFLDRRDWTGYWDRVRHAYNQGAGSSAAAVSAAAPSVSRPGGLSDWASHMAQTSTKPMGA